MIFSAAARGVNLLLAFGAFFLGFLVVDYFWGSRTLKKLSVKRNLPDSIHAGEPFYVEIEIDATRRRSPCWAIVVEDLWEAEDRRFAVPEKFLKAKSDVETVIDKNESFGKTGKFEKKYARSEKKFDMVKSDLSAVGGRSESGTQLDASSTGTTTSRPVVYFPTVPSSEKVKEYYVGVTPRRGRLRLTGMTISTRFPCGFFRSMEYVSLSEEILVFPKTGFLTNDWDAYFGNLIQESSIATNQISRAPDETVSIRDWRSGDSSRTIAWRATAKRNRLQTREFSRRQTRTTVVILDLFVSEIERQACNDVEFWERVEKAVSFTATLINEWTTGNSRLVFTVNGRETDNSSIPSEEAGDKTHGEWNEILGKGSTYRTSSRLAVVLETHVDRLNEILHSARFHAPRESQIVVVSLGSKREVTATGLHDSESVLKGVEGDNVTVIDVSSPDFGRYFQFVSQT